MTRFFLTVLLLIVAATTAVVNAPAQPRSTRARPAEFQWSGTFDLIGTGFPEGERVAVVTIAARDTGYHMTIAGPPGALKALRIVGDSAHVTWDLGGTLMLVDLRGVADSLDGRWTIGDRSGDIFGTRRRR